MFQKLKAKFFKFEPHCQLPQDFTVCQTVLGAGADGRTDNDSDWVDGCGDCLGAKTIYGCCYG